MNRLLGWMAVLFLLVSQAGCGTIMNFMGKGHGVREDYGQMSVYGGVGIDVLAVSEAQWPWEKLWSILVMLIDLPLSFAVDTVTLPITIPVSLNPESGKDPLKE